MRFQRLFPRRRTRGRFSRWRLVRVLLLCLLPTARIAGAAENPITLDEALRQAREANVKLPVAALDVAIATQKRAEARAERWLRVAVEGNFVYAPPSGYDPVVTNSGEFKLQAVGRQPLFDGGARRAAVARAEGEIDAASGRYRLAQKDLDLEVVTRYNEILAADDEAAARRYGITRLESYRTSLRSRQASGQAVTGDLLRTEVRMAAEQASVLEAERRASDARLALNALMGREPRLPLEVVPLPAVGADSEPPATAGWQETPDVAAARADSRVAAAAAALARAEWKPHLDLSADVGFWGSDTSRLVPLDLKMNNRDATLADRFRRDAGYSFTLTFSLPIFDFGTIRARVAQADLAFAQARQRIEVARWDARLKWEQARFALETLGREVALLSHAAPFARDASLDAESRYRGGAATSLEVLDAYAASIDAAVKLSDASSRYRIAQALARRWGTP